MKNNADALLQQTMHFLISADTFESMESYCLHLMHMRGYQESSAYAKNKAVLDLGCNTGYGTHYLSQFADRVVGIDVSENAIAKAKATYQAPNLEYLLVEGKQLPFPSQSFDLIISSQVIEHIYDYELYLSEICRVLAPGGVVMFTTPNASIRLDPGMKPWNEFHVHEFTSEDLHELLSRWFDEVNVSGLFGKQELYDIEYNRVSRIRTRAREQAQRLIPPYWVVKEKVINAIKRILPDSAVRLAQGLVRRLGNKAGPAKPAPAPEPTPSLSQEQLSLFSVADLFYSSTDLDRALDLLALCGKPKPGPAGE